MIRPNYNVVTDVAGRSYGGFTNPYACFTHGTHALFFHGEHNVAGTTVLASIPSGNNPPVAWMPALKAGALSARQELAGAGAILPFALVPGWNLDAALAGTGDLAGVGELIVSLQAALAGSGSLTAAAEGYLQFAAVLAGSGDLAGALGALAHAAAALAGAGDISAAIRALGTLEAALVLTGGTLTTSNVGEAVWAYLIDSGYTAAEIQRLLAAVAAGKTAGAGTSEMTFRDLADSKDRVTGTMDGSGNRTAVTLDAT